VVKLTMMGTETRFPESGPIYRVVKSGWEPPALGPEARAEVEAFDRALAAYLEPAAPGYVSGRIATTLAHYFVPDIPAPLQRAMLADWQDALAEFPAWAIANACQAWLVHERRKPTPADVVTLCRAEVRSWAAMAFVVRKTLDKDEAAGRSAQRPMDRLAIEERLAAGVGPG